MLTANRWRGWHLAVVAVLLGAVMACEWGGKHLLRFPEPAASPTTFTAAEILSVPLDAFRNYAKGLPYDSVSGAGDEQRLLLRIEVHGKDTTRFYGPLARIEPVRRRAGHRQNLVQWAVSQTQPSGGMDLLVG